ncbi:MAG: LacI family transcriptional regulator [Turicibacter sp.]|nr:LacI family transcriptional regulator [Turicibacter sp.]
MKNVTIDMVSKAAGVSKTTISRYLNEKYEHMSEKTRLRIKATIKELDYRPSIMARSLKAKKTGLIGIIISDMTNPVTISLIKGVMDKCESEGFQVITASSDEDVQKEKEYILSMFDRQVEGLIVNVADYMEYSTLLRVQEKGMHIVLADRTIDTQIFDTVTTNNYEMSKDTVKKLYNVGYEAVALFSSNLLKSNVRLARYQGFLAAAENCDNSDNEYIFADDNLENFKVAITDFVRKYPNSKKAVFASTPMALLNLVTAAHELNVRIPNDLAICGYDNLQWTRLVSGGITVVEQPFYEVGVESAKILLKRIRGEDDIEKEPIYLELKSKLIRRGST